jgi:D-galactose 1-dehydrogenase
MALDIVPTTPISLGIIGVGKIARDQHLPTLRSSDAFKLVGVVSLPPEPSDVPSFLDLQSLAKAVPDLAAVALCTPPQVRYDIAREALERGFHVLLEKPPGVTVSEVQALLSLAQHRNLTLFASWHSRYAPAVEPARSWISTRQIRRVAVSWKEDVRVWHPGQKWIWRAGGLGVFDPGINALSILTHILPGDLVLKEAELQFPSNCATPIAARLSLSDARGAPIDMELDFLQRGPQTWDIVVDTDDGTLTLTMGGKLLSVDGVSVSTADVSEYGALYSHFADLVRIGCSDVDLTPLQLVADAFLCGRRREVDPFVD